MRWPIRRGPVRNSVPRGTCPASWPRSRATTPMLQLRQFAPRTCSAALVRGFVPWRCCGGVRAPARGRKPLEIGRSAIALRSGRGAEGGAPLRRRRPYPVAVVGTGPAGLVCAGKISPRVDSTSRCTTSTSTGRDRQVRDRATARTIAERGPGTPAARREVRARVRNRHNRRARLRGILEPSSWQSV